MCYIFSPYSSVCVEYACMKGRLAAVTLLCLFSVVFFI